MAPELPRATIVVPVLEGATVVVPLLESLLALDYPRDGMEVIVVDNGSRDPTPELIRQFPVKLIREQRVRSSYAARNRGVAASHGEWVVFTDADCRVPRDWLKVLLAPPLPATIGAVAGEVLALPGGNAVQRLTERYGLVRHGVTLPHKALPCFSTAAVAVRRSALEALSGFREDIRFFGDMDLSWRLQIQLGLEVLFRPQAAVHHLHRRTYPELLQQGIQHGRGVAFMKRSYPARYRIHLGEQARRVAEMVRLAGRALAAPASGGPERDRLAAPGFLFLWYAGMLAGYLIGPAWTRRRLA